ncbi:hypothetical protein GOV05_02165 [Candidatus Woesearchaeota archaeon]|nr:hypothetical protein [Candidatus Woesearchaeota archaeon]
MQKSECKQCGSTNTHGISRVVGYYSIIENWNTSKQAEFKDRQIGDYKLNESELIPERAERLQAKGEQEVIVVI